MFRIIKELDIKFMEIRKIPLILSSLLLAVSILSIVIKGFNFGIDFSSGYIVQLKFDNKVTVIDVQDKLSKNNLSDSTVQLYGSSKEILIKLINKSLKSVNRLKFKYVGHARNFAEAMYLKHV